MSNTLDEGFSTGGGEDFMRSLRADLGLTPEGEPATEETAPEATGTTETPAGADNSDADTTSDEPDWKKQYEELQSLMGRMSNELGELRKERQAEETPEPEFGVPVPITDEVETQLADAIDRNGGEQIAAWAAVNAPHLYERTLDLWADSGAPGAARRAAQFDMEFRAGLARYEEEQQMTENEKFLAELNPLIETSLNTLAPEYGVTVGDPATDALLAATLDAAPAAIQNLVVSKDEGERDAGLRAVLALAVATGGAVTTGQPATADGSTAAALAAAKGQASLGTGGLTLQSGDQTAPVDPQEAFLEELQGVILQTPSTSVAAGLRRGNEPLFPPS